MKRNLIKLLAVFTIFVVAAGAPAGEVEDCPTTCKHYSNCRSDTCEVDCVPREECSGCSYSATCGGACGADSTGITVWCCKGGSNNLLDGDESC